MNAISFDAPISFTMPDGTISNSGIAEIVALMRAQSVKGNSDVSDMWKSLNPNYAGYYLPDLPDNWIWTWIVQRGEYAGTFPKRVAKFLWKKANLHCPESFLSELGNIARRHSSEARTYYIDFAGSIDWQDGDFGDEGSCYWGDNEAAQGILEENGAFAIRFYSDDTFENGIGRAWIYERRNNFVLWNGYGVEDRDATLNIARIFAAYLGKSYSRVHLTNNGSEGGTVYINGGRGYLIGEASEIEAINYVDLKLGDPEYGYCEICNRSLNSEDDVYYNGDGIYYCEECFDERYTRCDMCGRVESNDDITTPDDSPDSSLCWRCVDSHTNRCSYCEKVFYNTNTYEHSDGEMYCMECLPPETSELEDSE